MLESFRSSETSTHTGRKGRGLTPTTAATTRSIMFDDSSLRKWFQKVSEFMQIAGTPIRRMVQA